MKTTKTILTIAAVAMILVSLNQAVYAAPGWNSTSLNGVSFNGVYLNGVYLNGVYLNGVYLNGVTLNGRILNGVTLNGVTLNAENYEVDSTQIKPKHHTPPNGFRIIVVTEEECKKAAPIQTAIIK